MMTIIFLVVMAVIASAGLRPAPMEGGISMRTVMTIIQSTVMDVIALVNLKPVVMAGEMRTSNVMMATW